MINKRFIFVLIFLVAEMLVCFFVQAQRTGVFELNGTIVHNKKRVNGAIVRVFLDSTKIDSFRTISDGKFHVEMKLNRNYIVEFYKYGTIPKRIAFDTHVPEDSRNNSYITNIDIIQLDDLAPGVDISATKKPIAKYKINAETGSIYDTNLDYSQNMMGEYKSLKQDVEESKKLYAAIREEINNLSPEARKSLGIEMKMWEANKKADNILSRAHEVLVLANKQRDSIIKDAQEKSKKIFENALQEQVKRSKSIIDSNQTLSSLNELKALSVDSTDFVKRKDIDSIREQQEKISKKEQKSTTDTLEMLENNLYVKNEVLKVARYQLEIDRLNAKTKEDSLEIEKRAAMIDAREKELLLTRQEIENARNKIQLQELEIRQKTTFLFSSLIGLLLLFVLLAIVYLNYKRKKKTNQILRAKNDEIMQKNTLIEAKNKEITAKNKHITDSITYASKIQEAILPSKRAIKDHFPESFIFYRPRDIVSGDFYWFSELNGKLFIAAVDCTGHSVPGAFMSMIGNTLLNQIVNEEKNEKPSEILNRLNSGIIRALKQQEETDQIQDDGMDITLCCIDKKTKNVELACANHFAYLVRNDDIQVIEGDIFSIGGSLTTRYEFKFENHRSPIEDGTKLYMFSDGFQDQFGEKTNKKFMEKKFRNLIFENRHMSMNEQYELLDKTFEEWKGNKSQLDDVLVIGIKILT